MYCCIARVLKVTLIFINHHKVADKFGPLLELLYTTPYRERERERALVIYDFCPNEQQFSSTDKKSPVSKLMEKLLELMNKLLKLFIGRPALTVGIL